MTKNPTLPCKIDLFRYGVLTYALHTYPDGKQAIWVQLGTDKFIETQSGIPEGAIKYDPNMCQTLEQAR